MPTFTTLFTKPAAPTALTLTPDEGFSRMVLSWTATADTYFDHWAVYRSILGGEYVRVDPGDLTNGTVKTWTDHWAPVGVEVSYRVTQSNGAVESDPVQGMSRLANFSGWIGIPGDDARTIEIVLVEAFRISPYLEEEVNRPLGRWSALVVSEEEGSPEVEMEFSVDPESRGIIDRIREIGNMVRTGEADHAFLKSPHGHSLKVAPGRIPEELDRAGYEKVILPATVIDA